MVFNPERCDPQHTMWREGIASEYRQAAGAIAQDVKSSAELCEIPALCDQQRRKQ
jgi:hypothetical protein